MKKSKKIKVVEFAIFQSYMAGLLGLGAGILYSFGGAILDTLVTLSIISSNETPGLSYGTLLAFGALIGMPLIFAIFGLIAGLFEALIYNLVARWTAGVNIKFKE